MTGIHNNDPRINSINLNQNQAKTAKAEAKAEEVKTEDLKNVAEKYTKGEATAQEVKEAAAKEGVKVTVNTNDVSLPDKAEVEKLMQDVQKALDNAKKAGDTANVEKFSKMVDMYDIMSEILNSKATPQEKQLKIAQLLADYNDVSTPQEQIDMYKGAFNKLADVAQKSGDSKAEAAVNEMISILDELESVVKDNRMSKEEKQKSLENIKTRASKLEKNDDIKNVLSSINTVDPNGNEPPQPEMLFLSCGTIYLILMVGTACALMITEAVVTLVGATVMVLQLAECGGASGGGYYPPRCAPDHVNGC